MGLFLKLSDGESVNGVFRGEIYEFKIKWEANKSQVVGDTDPDGKARFRLNFVTYDQAEKKFVAKVFEFGLVVYGQLASINEEYPLENTKIKITRRGTGTSTEYIILPLIGTQHALSPPVLKQIEAVPLNMLEHKTKGAGDAVQETNAWDGVPDETDESRNFF